MTFQANRRQLLFKELLEFSEVENNGSVEVPSVKVLEDRLKRPKHYRRGGTVYITGNSSLS